MGFNEEVNPDKLCPGIEKLMNRDALKHKASAADEQTECQNNERIQFINSKKMLDGKFYILDSDEDSSDEELYSAKQKPN